MLCDADASLIYRNAVHNVIIVCSEIAQRANTPKSNAATNAPEDARSRLDAALLEDGDVAAAEVTLGRSLEVVLELVVLKWVVEDVDLLDEELGSTSTVLALLPVPMTTLPEDAALRI